MTGGPPSHLVGTAGARAELEADLAQANAARSAAACALAKARQSGRGVEAKAEALAKAEENVTDARLALDTVAFAQAAVAAPASGAASAVGLAASALGRSGVEMRVDQGTTGVARIDAAISHAIANPELTLYKLKTSAYKFSFMLVPISLPFRLAAVRVPARFDDVRPRRLRALFAFVHVAAHRRAGRTRRARARRARRRAGLRRAALAHGAAAARRLRPRSRRDALAHRGAGADGGGGVRALRRLNRHVVFG